MNHFVVDVMKVIVSSLTVVNVFKSSNNCFLVTDNINDFFDILMQKDNVDDAAGIHQVVRKSRGPQLRLRFGKRSDYVSDIFYVEFLRTFLQLFSRKGTLT